MADHSDKVAPHLHISMQSGSDSVLRRMRRRWGSQRFIDRCRLLQERLEQPAITTDIIVGFPGETDAEFEETRHMIEDLPFTYLHVFTFSVRPGTPAASMANQVPVRVARARNQILRELADVKKQAFMRSFAGRELDAITLNVTSQDSGGIWTEALTDNYLKLRLRGNHAPNQWLQARITGVEGGELLGEAHLIERSCA